MKKVCGVPSVTPEEVHRRGHSRDTRRGTGETTTKSRRTGDVSRGIVKSGLYQVVQEETNNLNLIPQTTYVTCIVKLHKR